MPLVVLHLLLSYGFIHSFVLGANLRSASSVHIPRSAVTPQCSPPDSTAVPQAESANMTNATGAYSITTNGPNVVMSKLTSTTMATPEASATVGRCGPWGATCIDADGKGVKSTGIQSSKLNRRSGISEISESYLNYVVNCYVCQVTDM
ncbi:hypothetical protein B0H13DRAFT_1892641 [Mycena leptocephala]|nr:hypothetical protein B0H13DRAFT_1892641 [Mycena leptocephala]